MQGLRYGELVAGAPEQSCSGDRYFSHWGRLVGREEHDFRRGRRRPGSGQKLKTDFRKALLDFCVFLKDPLIEIIVRLTGDRVNVDNVPFFLFYPAAFHPLNLLKRF
jgi:hypothetical protein